MKASLRLLALCLAAAFNVCLPENAFAGRTLSLFWEEDIHLSPSSPIGVVGENRFRVSLTETVFAPRDGRCFVTLNHTSLFFSALQLGGSCAVRTGARHLMSIGANPEIAFRRGDSIGSKFRPSLATSLTQSIELGDALDGSMVFANFHYKFVPYEGRTEDLKLTGSGWESVPLQKWNDLLQTYYSIGWVGREWNPETQKQDWAVEVLYREALPLEVRRTGALEFSASTSFKMLQVESRWLKGPMVLGLGAGYFILTVDNLRFGFPYPVTTVAYEF